MPFSASLELLPEYCIGSALHVKSWKRHRKWWRRKYIAQEGMHMHEPIFLTEKEAAALIGYSTWTLGRWRTNGGGPPFIRLPKGGRIQYNKAKLIAWFGSYERGSTAEYDTWQRPSKARTAETPETVAS